MNLSSLNHVLDAGFQWTCQATLSATVLIALVLLAQAFFGRVLPARWRYALGLLVLLRLVLPVTPASSWSIFNLEKHFASRRQPAEMFAAALPKPPVPAPIITGLSAIQTSPDTSAPVFGVAPASRDGVHAEAPSSPEAPVATTMPTQPHLTLRASAQYLWLLGALAMLLTVARRHQKFSATLRSWEPVREPRVLELLARCQAMLGIRRRVIVL